MKLSAPTLLVTAALLAPASASASSVTFCVPDPGPGWTNHNTLTVQAGLSHALHATVRIAAGSYGCPTGGFTQGSGTSRSP